MEYKNTLETAQNFDKEDSLRHFREKFYIPQVDGKEAIYLCGNSLGLQPKTANDYILTELEAWRELGVEGHFKGKNPWMYYHKLFSEQVSELVGAKREEVVVMNNLTVNLHLLLVSFYQPKGKRYKIVMEGGAFPSDQYAIESQVKFHGYNPEDAIIELKPIEGEYHLRTEHILSVLESQKDEIALVMLGGVNYYTGQVFDMESITKKGKGIGANVGFDLAHAAGNVALNLHDWEVDFAVWCTYKYLNSGPGGTSGVFVHQKHGNNPELPRLAGWWGHKEDTRFLMQRGFIPMQGAEGWQLSNAQIFPMALHKASLDIFSEATMQKLVAKSKQLTGYLRFLIDELIQTTNSDIKVITPINDKEYGCQVSLLTGANGKQLFNKIQEAGVIADWREPNVIRVAPVPLYNTFEDVFRFANLLFPS